MATDGDGDGGDDDDDDDDFFIHSCSDGVKIYETQSTAPVGERPRGGGNESRANRLADPSEVALMCVLLVRPLHPSASSGGPMPSTGTP